MKQAILLVFFTSTFTLLFAQKNQLPFGRNTIELDKNTASVIATKFTDQVFEDHLYLLLQFNQAITPQLLEELEQYEIIPIRYLGNSTFLSITPNKFNFNNLQQLNIQQLSALEAENKIDIQLNNQTGKVEVLIKFYLLENKEAILAILSDFGKILTYPYPSMSNAIALQTNASQLEKIAALPFLEYIQRAYFDENFGNDNLAI
ncbi:MAG: hypothetical protein AAF806_31580, partial [Bacteroidota bacterium]